MHVGAHGVRRGHGNVVAAVIADDQGVWEAGDGVENVVPVKDGDSLLRRIADCDFYEKFPITGGEGAEELAGGEVEEGEGDDDDDA